MLPLSSCFLHLFPLNVHEKPPVHQVLVLSLGYIRVSTMCHGYKIYKHRQEEITNSKIKRNSTQKGFAILYRTFKNVSWAQAVPQKCAHFLSVHRWSAVWNHRRHCCLQLLVSPGLEWDATIVLLPVPLAGDLEEYIGSDGTLGLSYWCCYTKCYSGVWTGSLDFGLVVSWFVIQLYKSG